MAESKKDAGRHRTPRPGAAGIKAQTATSASLSALLPLPQNGAGAKAVLRTTVANTGTPNLATPSIAAVEDDTPAELLLVGRLVAAQGLAGEVRVQPLSDFPERFTSPGRRWLRRGGEPAWCCQLLSGRQLPGRELFVLRLAGIDNRTEAEALVGAELLVAGDDRPALGEGEFHLLDLVGLEVRLLPEGRPIGRVEDLIHAGQDLLEITLWSEDAALPTEGTSASGQGRNLRCLIPFVHAIVPEVHLVDGWLGVTPPPGLLELETG